MVGQGAGAQALKAPVVSPLPTWLLALVVRHTTQAAYTNCHVSCEYVSYPVGTGVQAVHPFQHKSARRPGRQTSDVRGSSPGTTLRTLPPGSCQRLPSECTCCYRSKLVRKELEQRSGSWPKPVHSSITGRLLQDCVPRIQAQRKVPQAIHRDVEHQDSGRAP